ncbi:polysaccharide biosynthesis/export family protein [Arcicella lustrica]|uniref:Polysaccharide biosynthesis/export family protein n=1 Tax=Arcicella lustrica TaxID=2984196 RepID=A0ABU5SNS8_9BACT|nr:polysaccharide biosynthesis/export family protein [Arcicella sp. DC25W]MEA5428973.1 polysaccharide biosynthesis/export family protein [Arcicella sp. DC25W]
MKNLFSKKSISKDIKLLLMMALSLSFFTSCVSTKNVTYFQGSDPLDTVRYSILKTVTPLIPKIQPDDILAVTVSSLSIESNEVFNFQNVTPLITTNFPGVSSNGIARNQPLGYLVDPSGNIELPLIGKILVINLTLEEAEIKIKRELAKYLKEPTANVRFLNQKVTILGEVNRPGIYNLTDNHTSLPELLGIAGDLTIYGRRDNIMLIRTTDGKKEIVKLNINTREVFETPYYYIRNGDVIYVEPTKGKITSSDRTLQLIPIATGVTTSLVLLLNLLFK